MSTGRVFAAIGLAGLAACAISRRPSEQAAVTWECDTDTTGMAATIAGWAKAIVSGSTEDLRGVRRAHGFAAMPADSVHIVSDQHTCASAGQAYLERTRAIPGRHRVAVVSVGDRYIAIDMGQVSRAGEFLSEAILDRRFRVLSWILT